MHRNQIDQLYSTSGVDAAMEGLAAELSAARRYHDRFDLRLLQARHKLGLSVVGPPPLDDLPEPERSAMEEASLAACREAGLALLGDGKLREAWMYLRPVGEREPMAQALVAAIPNENNLNELVELSLYEGIEPEYGFSLVLNHFGVCNAITTFESVMLARPVSQQQATAAQLLRRVHRDLIGNVRADIARQEGAEPKETTLAALVADRDWLFTENNYHLDTTHLNATVRFARLVTDAEALRLALDITEYGRRLAHQFQFAGEEPFVDTYSSHAIWFRAFLGVDVEQAIAFFTERAEQVDPVQHGAAAIEMLILLLSRLGRYEQAIDVAVKMPQTGLRTSGYAPSLLELAHKSGKFQTLLDAAADRDDWLTYVSGLLLRESSVKQP